MNSRTDEQIQKEISDIVSNILNQEVGNRDFSILTSLDKELSESRYMNSIKTLTFHTIVEAAENAFLVDSDIQFILNLLYDARTLPSDTSNFFINEYLTHNNLFKNTSRRVFSVLDENKDIETQFEILQSGLLDYQEAAEKIYFSIQNAVIIYKNKDTYDMSDMYDVDRRLSVLSGFLLSDISENEINEARKALIAYALNGDCENAMDCYETCVKYLYEKYFMKNKKNLKIPTTDILISEAIIYANNYADVDLSKNIDLFMREYRYDNEMKGQINLINKIYKYLNLNIKL